MMTNRIKELRVRKNIKQADLAKVLSVSQATLSNWERGEFEPDKDSIIKLAEVLESTTDYILGYSDQLTNYTAQNIQNSNFVQGNGTVTVSDIKITKEEAEILRVYRLLNVRERSKLMNVVFDMEEKATLNKEANE